MQFFFFPHFSNSYAAIPSISDKPLPTKTVPAAHTSSISRLQLLFCRHWPTERVLGAWAVMFSRSNDWSHGKLRRTLDEPSTHPGRTLILAIGLVNGVARIPTNTCSSLIIGTDANSGSSRIKASGDGAATAIVGGAIIDILATVWANARAGKSTLTMTRS